MSKKKYIVLLGASVGQAWKIDALPERLKDNSDAGHYRFEYVGDFQFDKTDKLETILTRKKNRPDVIILKECAVYFPGDLEKYKGLMKEWIADCRQAGVIPIPTTVVPVVRESGIVTLGKDLIKSIIGRPISGKRLEEILQYNDWIKTYAINEKLKVLDLEAVVRISREDRSLRLDLHSGDGIHLNAAGYALLDKIVIPTLNEAVKVKYK